MYRRRDGALAPDLPANHPNHSAVVWADHEISDPLLAAMESAASSLYAIPLMVQKLVVIVLGPIAGQATRLAERDLERQAYPRPASLDASL